MGADSGSFVGSTSGSFFGSSNASNSNCSVKSRQGTSSSSSSNHNYGNLFGGDISEKNKLLNSKIIEINIGIEPIGPKIGHFLTNNIIVNPINTRVFIPIYFLFLKLYKKIAIASNIIINIPRYLDVVKP
jgi:hypothetical protein